MLQVFEGDKYQALVGSYNGLPCAILVGDYIPPFSEWIEIEKDEFDELRDSGFHVRAAFQPKQGQLV